MKIPKKGNLSNCKNWRGINLLCVASKVFCKIILTRMMEVLEKASRISARSLMCGPNKHPENDHRTVSGNERICFHTSGENVCTCFLLITESLSIP